MLFPKHNSWINFFEKFTASLGLIFISYGNWALANWIKNELIGFFWVLISF